MVYKIQGLVDGIWMDDAVGGSTEDNRFATEEEAAEMLPILAKSFECGIDELRVVQAD